MSNFMSKKSWHTGKVSNHQKVWEAEQRKRDEDNKIAQLRKERAEERRLEELRRLQAGPAAKDGVARRIDWMYKGPEALKREEEEEFLLGKEAPAAPAAAAEGGAEKAGKAEGALFVRTKKANSAREEEALARDDPLTAIMRAEAEQREALLANPARMRELERRAKLLKKLHSGAARSGDSSSDSGGSDSSDSGDSEDSRDRKRKRKKRGRKHSKKHSKKRSKKKRSKKKSDKKTREERKRGGSDLGGGGRKRARTDDVPSPTPTPPAERWPSDDRRSDNSQQQRDWHQYDDRRRRQRRHDDHWQRRERSRSPARTQRATGEASAEERLRAMMDDADAHHMASVRRLREEEDARRREEREYRSRHAERGDGAPAPSFLGRVTRDAYLGTSDSLADRLGKNKHLRQQGDASSRADAF